VTELRAIDMPLLVVRDPVVRETAPERLREIRRLLSGAFEGDFSQEDWEHTCGGWRVIALDDETVVSHAAVVPRTILVGTQPLRAGYVEGVATRTDRQREGLGSRVMYAVSRLLHSDFEIGVLSTGRHGFYESVGWERWLGPSFVRDGDRTVRTADEDDGIMVLRAAAGPELDLTAAITCDRRPGDDW
jgi:aminoglycoside 2'-N-acetyltransferase I